MSAESPLHTGGATRRQVEELLTMSLGVSMSSLLLPLLCPEPHVNMALRWEVRATRRVTVLYIYAQWKVFPHLSQNPKYVSHHLTFKC